MSSQKIKDKKKQNNKEKKESQVEEEAVVINSVPKSKKDKKNAAVIANKDQEKQTLNEGKASQRVRKADLVEEVPEEIQPKKKKNKTNELEQKKPVVERKQKKVEEAPSAPKAEVATNNENGEKASKKNKKPALLKKKQDEVAENKKNGKGRIFDKSKGKKGKQEKERGVIYIGHLPYGFVEEGLRGYFEQYGDITHLRLARSKRTARSKGYGFVEFKFKEVAEIAAKAMNGYIINGKTLKCHVLEKDKANPFSFRFGSKKFKYIPWKRIFIKEKNKEKSEDKLRKHVKNLLKKEEEKRQKLEELGIEYEFPGYRALVEETAE